MKGANYKGKIDNQVIFNLPISLSKETIKRVKRNSEEEKIFIITFI